MRDASVAASQSKSIPFYSAVLRDGESSGDIPLPEGVQTVSVSIENDGDGTVVAQNIRGHIKIVERERRSGEPKGLVLWIPERK